MNPSDERPADQRRAGAPDPAPVTMLGNLDLSGVLRGRSFPSRRTEQVLAGGLPWVPANILLSPLNTIPAANPFGALGETRLRDAGTRAMTLPARADRPAMQLRLADIVDTDDVAWPVCPRGQLQAAIEELHARHGLRVQAGFEHECYLPGLQDVPTPAFSLQGSRAVSGLAEEVYGMLSSAGCALDQFVAEFGEHQFEIASPPLAALAAADHAVLSREAIRDAARARGARASFAPKPLPDAPGSGVHIHVSLWRGDAPVTATTPVAAHRTALTEPAGAFVAGVLAHIDTVLAFTTGSVNSFARLRPSSWVGIHGCFGTRNREAALRLCPRQRDEHGLHRAASIEWRIADASANPYLSLAALIRAGMAGLDAGLPAPEDVQLDPATLDAAQRRIRGISDLPEDLERCLARLEASGRAGEWFGEMFEAAFLSVRHNDIADAHRLGNAYAAAFSQVI